MASRPSVTSADFAEPTADALLDIFHTYDEDRSGTLEPSELACVLQSLDPDLWTDAKIEKLMGTLDKNGDNAIQVDEFIHWAFESFESPEFRRHLGLKKPKVLWKNFEMTVSLDSNRKVLKEVHPAHLAKALFERIAIEFGLSPSELTLIIGDGTHRQISFGAVGDQHLSDFGFVDYCYPDATIPQLQVQKKPKNDEIIYQLGKAREEQDEALRDMWFSPCIENYRFRATKLEEPGFECKIKVIHKPPPPKKSPIDDDIIITDYPIVVFYIEDHDRPATLYGKYVFPITDEFPGTKNGVPEIWSKTVNFTGALENADLKASVEEVRARTRHQAEEMSTKAEELKDPDMRIQAENLRKSAMHGIPLKPLSKPEREMIQDVVAPFVMRVWKKYAEYKAAGRTDGQFVCNPRADGFEIGPPHDVSPDPRDELKRWANTVGGIPLADELRLFKALHLLSADAKE